MFRVVKLMGVGNEGDVCGDTYAESSVGDFGANQNSDWNGRFNSDESLSPVGAGIPTRLLHIHWLALGFHCRNLIIGRCVAGSSPGYDAQ